MIGPHGAYHDSLMAVEVGRQAVITLSHAHYGVSRSLMMIARSATIKVRDRELCRDGGTTPLERFFVMRPAAKKVPRWTRRFTMTRRSA